MEFDRSLNEGSVQPNAEFMDRSVFIAAKQQETNEFRPHQPFRGDS
jgi:hypothetical protein